MLEIQERRINACRNVCLGFVIVAVCLLASAVATATDVSVGVSSQETYVGLPVTLQIRVDDSDARRQPEVPDVDGLTIESTGRPSVTSQTFNINGRRSSRTSTIYQYRVTPQREGTFTIPPIKVAAGGITTITKAVRLSVTKSETGDLMFVEVAGDRDQTFVGQPLTLTLQIWLRPFRDAETRVALDEGQMWQLFSSQSTWGQFGERLQAMAEDRKRPGGQTVLKEDSEGVQREYFLYEIDATVYPTRPGKIDADDIRIIADYPTEIGRQRDSFSSLFEDSGFPFGGSMMNDDFFRGFGSRLAITDSRPIVGEANIKPITVKPIPEQGRPADYLGAVGQYSIEAEATPESVKVGDPITLTLRIRGTGPMDLVRSPQLASQPDLANDFKVSDDDLAGFVDGKQKIFQTTIRPKHENASEIPSITFSYFDPDLEQFVTVATDPIRIDVQPGDLLTLDSIVADRPAAIRPESSPSRSSLLPTQPRATMRLFPADQIVADRSRTRLIDATLAVSFGLPPMLFAIILLLKSRHRLDGLTTPKRRFERTLQAAETPTDIAVAIETWMTARFAVDADRKVSDQVVGQLRRSGDSDLAIQIERLFAKLRLDSVPAGDLKREARELVRTLSDRASSGLAPTRFTKRGATSVLVLAAVFGVSAIAEAAETELTLDQRMTMAKEAIQNYRAASSASNPDEAKAQFAVAADTFAAIAQSNISNDRLLFNLGNAYLQSGQTGRAIAAYRSALKRDPANSVYYDNWLVAKATGKPRSFLGRTNDAILRAVHPRNMKTAGIIAWSAFWLGCIVSLLVNWPSGGKALLRSCCGIALIVAIISTSSYFARTIPLAQDGLAVLVGEEIIIREGDGDSFAELGKASEGETAAILDRRGGWTKVKRDGGTVGWIASNKVVPI